jgi:hypothetical protein
MLYISSESLQDTAGIPGLQGEAKLYTQETETHIKYLPEI